MPDSEIFLCVGEWSAVMSVNFLYAVQAETRKGHQILELNYKLLSRVKVL